MFSAGKFISLASSIKTPDEVWNAPLYSLWVDLNPSIPPGLGIKHMDRVLRRSEGGGMAWAEGCGWGAVVREIWCLSFVRVVSCPSEKRSQWSFTRPLSELWLNKRTFRYTKDNKLNTFTHLLLTSKHATYLRAESADSIAGVRVNVLKRKLSMN